MCTSAKEDIKRLKRTSRHYWKRSIKTCHCERHLHLHASAGERSNLLTLCHSPEGHTCTAPNAVRCKCRDDVSDQRERRISKTKSGTLHGVYPERHSSQ